MTKSFLQKLEAFKNLERASLLRKIPILGHEKGLWLYKKILELQPNSILELGTANGYSGIILGYAGASLTTIEINQAIAEEAKNNFKNFNINAVILIADAVKEIKKFPDSSFDLIFIDFAKKKYLSVLEESIRIVRKKGYIIADNLSMSGCQDYKEKVVSDKRLKTRIIKIKDCLSISQKL